MNIEAQNALLKTLEEPPGLAIIILITSNYFRLLETIRSRCQIVQFNFVSSQEMAAFPGLQGKSNQNEILHLSFGRPGRMVEFATDPACLQEWQNKIVEFSHIINANLPTRFAYVAKVAQSLNLEEWLEIWQVYFREQMLDAINQKITNRSQSLINFYFLNLKILPPFTSKICADIKKITS